MLVCSMLYDYCMMWVRPNSKIRLQIYCSPTQRFFGGIIKVPPKDRRQYFCCAMEQTYQLNSDKTAMCIKY